MNSQLILQVVHAKTGLTGKFENLCAKLKVKQHYISKYNPT